MIKLLVYIIVALLALSFFGISLQKIVEGPTAQANFHFVFDLAVLGFQYIVIWIQHLVNQITHIF
jgi:hypothetical protein